MAEKRTCPKCGAEVFASDDVCMDCGATLAAARQEHDEPRQSTAGPEAPPEPPKQPPPAIRWLWVPPLRSATRYPVLRIYQYACMVAAWGSLVSGILGAALAAVGWLGVRSDIGGVPADLDLVALAVAVGLMVLWSTFWAFTLRAVVEGIQVYLDIEENTRRAVEGKES